MFKIKARIGSRIKFNLLITLLLCGFLSTWLNIAVLSQCLPSQYRTIICTKAPSADGKVYVTVSINGGLPNEQQLIQNALDAWNAYSDITGVVFEAASAGTIADLTITYTENTLLNGECAAQDPYSQSIYWGMELRNRNLFMGEAEFTAVIMHEIGHFLGLDHTTSNDIMRQVPGQNCATPAGATNVTQSDAQQVAGCRLSFCRPIIVHHLPYGSGSSCYENYELVDYDYCNAEGCYTESRWEYTGMVCN